MVLSSFNKIWLLNFELAGTCGMASSGDRSKSLQDIVQCLHHCMELETWGLMVESSDEFLK